MTNTTKYNSITQDLPRSRVNYASETIEFVENVIDWDIRSNTSFFNRKVEVGRELVIRNTQPCFVKINSTENDFIELFANEGINTRSVPIENLFITAASGCILRLIITGWN